MDLANPSVLGAIVADGRSLSQIVPSVDQRSATLLPSRPRADRCDRFFELDFAPILLQTDFTSHPAEKPVQRSIGLQAVRVGGSARFLTSLISTTA
jgi:hypothetical protein